jgi:uncharacterized protein YecE (DUF72 family)
LNGEQLTLKFKHKQTLRWTKKAMVVRIGTSGWNYDDWEGVLYRPPATVATSSTIKPLRSWQQNLPQGFLMTVKAPRGLTHSKRLYLPERWVERMSKKLLCLGDRSIEYFARLALSGIYWKRAL